MMKGAYLPGNSSVELRELAVPEPGQGEECRSLREEAGLGIPGSGQSAEIFVGKGLVTPGRGGRAVQIACNGFRMN